MSDMGNRFRALDVLRGLTLALMIVVNMQIGDGKSYAPLLHAGWDGLTLTDLVFPTFMFVVGTTLTFTLEKYEPLGDAAVLRKIAMRTALIFLCGYLLYWFPFFRVDGTGHFVLAPIAYTRIFGVLQRIALGYGAAALIVHYGGRAGAISFGLSALLGYWWVMHAFGDYSLAGNAAIKLDKLVLGDAHMYHGEGVAFDPEGILSTLPAIVNVLAGYLAGRFIRNHGTNGGTIVRLLLAGTACIVLSLWWNTVFPINKKLWTSSYVLFAAGCTLLLLAVCFYALEIKKWTRGWTFPWLVFGSNAITAYVFSELLAAALGTIVVHDGGTATNLQQYIYQHWFFPIINPSFGSLMYAIAYVLVCFLPVLWMYRKKIFVKI
jgi:predicted acyltransferase